MLSVWARVMVEMYGNEVCPIEIWLLEVIELYLEKANQLVFEAVSLSCSGKTPEGTVGVKQKIPYVRAEV